LVNVSIVEAHTIQRMGLKALLESDPAITVSEASRSLRRTHLESADVLLLSYCATCDLPPVEDVAGVARKLRVVLFSGKETSISLLAYQNTNAEALIHQSDPEEKLFGSIRGFDSDPQDSQTGTARSVTGLSQRETLVLTLVGDGYTNDQIARRIGISKHTVDTYLRRIRSKLNLGNKAQLARAAMHLASAVTGGLSTTDDPR
jgi:DNA-binding NarL/FixJ family response regulator